MILTLQREPATEHSTPGTLAVDGVSECFTLEPPPVVDESQPGPVCVPAGAYPVTLSMSPKFGRIMPLLNDVPGRSRILIHWGNWVYDKTRHVFDTLGCIEVGQVRSNLDEILATIAAFNNLFPKIERAIRLGDSITIKIIDPDTGEAPSKQSAKDSAKEGSPHIPDNKPNASSDDI
jgi:hypothetical protein